MNRGMYATEKYRKHSIGNLVRLYLKSSQDLFELIVMADVEATNKKVDVLGQVWSELRSRGRDALSAFLPLLTHEHQFVRVRVALVCLEIAPEKAIAVLEDIKKNGFGIIAAEANFALLLWRSGEFKFP